MDHFYSQNARLSSIRVPDGTSNIPMLSPRVDSSIIAGKLRHKQLSRNPPTDYSPSYLNILRHLQANSPSSAVQNIEEGTLVVDIIRDEVSVSSFGSKNSRKTIHRIEEPSGSYRGHQWHHLKTGQITSRLPPRKLLEERRLHPRAIAEAATTLIVPHRSPKLQGKSNKIILHGDWSPLDDGIQVKLPFQSEENPSREDVNDYIKKFLHDNSIRRRRLPTFSQICSL